MPVNLECRVTQSLTLGAHTLFLGEIVAVHLDETVLDDGSLDVRLAQPIAFANGEYWTLGDRLGTYGLSQQSGR